MTTAVQAHDTPEPEPSEEEQRTWTVDHAPDVVAGLDRMSLETAELMVDPSELEAYLQKVSAKGDDGEVGILAGSLAGLAAFDRAWSQVGVTETGTNCNPYSNWLQKPCQPWCVDFISWAFDTCTCGNRNRVAPWNTSSVATLYDWAMANRGAGKLHFVLVPARGDICILGNKSHAGIVQVAADASGNFRTVDGNWSNRVSSNVSRNYKTQSFYFVRIAMTAGL